ncbi:MAG: HNH endonuclease [Actinomycetota bacterium]|nr:HNH endonuclease [Actinomycetota bacterium]
MSTSSIDTALAPPPEIAPAGPGTGARLLAVLEAFVASLREWPGALHQLNEVELADAVGSLLGVAGRAENVAALVAADALTRGTVDRSTATGAPGWVAQRARGVDPVVIRRVGAVATQCAQPRNLVVAQSLAAGSASVSAALVALREVPRVCAQLPGADRDQMLLRYLSLTGFGSRALTELSTRIIGQFAPEQLVHDEEVQQRRESVRWFELQCGLTRFEADLSAGHAATVKHALQFLSAPAPQPCPEGQATLKGAGSAPDRDLRTPANRRAGALVRLVETAADVLDSAAGRAVGEVNGTAKVVVTLDYKTLLSGLQEAGRLPTYLPGVGRTSDGDHLDPGTLRRLACDADIIPMVLGGRSEPLDVGRARRLFTGGLRAAIIHRDGGCTFPDCDRPPDWCDAHHVNPWWCGGDTNLANAALLCARHHTIVHRDLLTARVEATGVTWDLTPGLMPSVRAVA